MSSEEEGSPTLSDAAADSQATGTARAEDHPSAPERRIGPYRILRELGHGAWARSTWPHAPTSSSGNASPSRSSAPAPTPPKWSATSNASARSWPASSAVQYAHRNLVVHRDIKPGNILVTQDGSPRLLDFGIAKLLNPELAGEAPTATAMVMTPNYASPEQVRGEHITTATDVYSLGVVLYELLTGRHPYRLASLQPLDVLKAISEQEPERPSTAVERTEQVTAPQGGPPIRITPRRSRRHEREPRRSSSGVCGGTWTTS